MTNAMVADAVKSVDGGTVTVTHKGKEKTIAIPDGTPVVTFAPATVSDLKTGATVFVPSDKASDGSMSRRRRHQWRCSAEVICRTSGLYHCR